MFVDLILPRVTVSYHTSDDDLTLLGLAAALERHHVHGERLDYLTLQGFSTKEDLGGGVQRLDAWIENFLSLVEGSVGILVVQSAESRASEAEADRGMWIERQLLEHPPSQLPK